MNSISLISPQENRLDVVVDGRRLCEHFIGRRGAHPSSTFVLGWTGMAGGLKNETVRQLLGLTKPALPSGRVPILVCEDCGDVGCGAIAVCIERQATSIVWIDWAQENGRDAPVALSWPVYPERLEFDIGEYEKVFSNAVLGA